MYGTLGFVLIVRATKKVLDRVGGSNAAEGASSTTPSGDWYLNVWFWRPHMAVFVNEQTFFPVLMEFAPARTLLDRFPQMLASRLLKLGIPDSQVRREVDEMAEAAYAKTSSRSVLGVMNGYKQYAEHYARGRRFVEVEELSSNLEGMPIRPMRSTYLFPAREMARIMAGG